MEDTREDTIAIGGHAVVLTTTATAHGFRASIPIAYLPVSVSNELLRRARDWTAGQEQLNAISGVRCRLEDGNGNCETIVVEASNWRLTPEEYGQMRSALGEGTTAAMAAGAESPPGTLESVSV
jgi:hypothetical protein